MSRPLMIVAMLSLSFTAGAYGGEPFIARTDLYTSGAGGYALYRIPGIVALSDGTVLAYCEARKRAKGDWGSIDILMRRSTDDGQTWDVPRQIVTPPADVQQNPVSVAQGLAEPGEITLNNPVAIVTSDDTVHFLYCVEYARVFAMRSDDGGETFSQPREITSVFDALRPTYAWKVVATGPGHGIQLHYDEPRPEEGRLLVACWLSDGSGGHAHRPSIVTTIYSDDDGATWKCGEIVVAHPQLTNPSETVPIQLSDGQVMLNVRHENPNNRRALFWSDNGATGWLAPVFHDELLEPVCMASTVRLSGGPGRVKRSGSMQPERSRILFANPYSTRPRTDKKTTSRTRENVCVQLSYDEGYSWPVRRVLEPGPSGYSDLAVGPAATIYCLYESGRGTSRLTLARFNLEWLTDSNDSLTRK